MASRASPVIIGLLLVAVLAKVGATESDKDLIRKLTVFQKHKEVNWILPARRRLSLEVFGTSKKPERTGFRVTQNTKKLARRGVVSSSISEVLQQFPYLVGVPEDGRVVENKQLMTKGFTPFGNRVESLPSDQSNLLKITYRDYQLSDRRETTVKTRDQIRMECIVHDPEGNRYKISIQQIYMPPFPGYKTRGGVMIDSYHHGTTGTGSPLFPEVYTYGAVWGIGRVHMAGEDEMRVSSNRLIHVMTTEVARDQNQRLVLNEAMPLSKKQRGTKGKKPHQTHVLVYPIRISPDSPKKMKYSPLNTLNQVGKGKEKNGQSFIHVSFVNETILSGKKQLRQIPEHLQN